MIRPYKGLPDAIEVTRRIPEARLIVAGDPAMPLGDLRAPERVEWRLGYLSTAELDRALGEATVAVFPYRAELDQSGALLQALGAGVPAVVYDVGGLGEPVRDYGAGRVVAPGDVDAFTAAVRELLDSPTELARARAGALQARTELTWDAAAARHLELQRPRSAPSWPAAHPRALARAGCGAVGEPRGQQQVDASTSPGATTRPAP